MTQKGVSRRTSQEGLGLQAGCKSPVSQEEVKAELTEDIERDTEGAWESLIFAWRLGFLPTIVVWCMCPLGHPEVGQHEDKVPVSIISHLFPEARGSQCQDAGADGLPLGCASVLGSFSPGP